MWIGRQNQGDSKSGPHQGHSWPATSPELFCKVVTEFIGTVSGAAGGAPGELAGAGRA